MYYTQHHPTACCTNIFKNDVFLKTHKKDLRKFFFLKKIYDLCLIIYKASKIDNCTNT